MSLACVAASKSVSDDQGRAWHRVGESLQEGGRIQAKLENRPVSIPTFLTYLPDNVPWQAQKAEILVCGIDNSASA